MSADTGLVTEWGELRRDRLGAQPLHYTRTAGGLAYAADPRTLLALPGVARGPDPDFVKLYAAGHYRYFCNDLERSPWAAIRQVPAGHRLRWENGRIDVAPSWRLEADRFLDESETHLAERLAALLLGAVEESLRGAARPAFTLSGGMDSSSVISCAWKLTGKRQHAFSAVYGGGACDERADIETILADRVESWHPVHVDGENLFADIDRAIAAIGEPLPTVTWLANDHVCRAAAAAGHDVLLGGLGGDELCAGEYEHFLYHFADLRAAGDERALAREIDAWARLHDHPIHRKGRDMAESMLAGLTDPAAPGRCRPDRRRLERYAAALNRDVFDLREFEPVMDHPFPDCLRNRTSQDLLRETMPPCSRAAALQAMHYGLRAEHPFLEQSLVEFMFRVPGELKIRDGVTKVILRRAMAGLVPEATRARVAKTGWNAPADAWLAGPAFEDLMDLVRSQSFRGRGIYDAAEVERLAAEHRSIVHERRPVESHAMLLWQVVNLELWLREAESAPGPRQRAGSSAESRA